MLTLKRKLVSVSASARHFTPTKTHKSSAIAINPRTPNQKRYVELLRAETPCVVVASGSAGSGKTMLSALVGVEKLREGAIEKLIITRPAVSVDESHGFLPGTLEQKCEPWVRPVFDVLQKCYSMVEIERMLKERIIEISPLSYMRGRSFENAWIVCDEFQNVTSSQAVMVLTRFGEGCKLVITGDPMQHDRGFEENGLSDLLLRIPANDNDIAVVDFGPEDVIRHRIIPKILRMYEKK